MKKEVCIPAFPTKSYLCLQSWAGFQKIKCEVVGETPKKFKIRLLEEARLPGNRWKKSGDVVLVPKYALRERKFKMFTFYDRNIQIELLEELKKDFQKDIEMYRNVRDSCAGHAFDRITAKIETISDVILKLDNKIGKLTDEYKKLSVLE